MGSTGLLLNGWRSQRQQAQKQIRSMLSLIGSFLSGSVLRLSSSCTLVPESGVMKYYTCHENINEDVLKKGVHGTAQDIADMAEGATNL